MCFRKKVIPTFLMKNPDFISFLSESRDNSKVVITISSCVYTQAVLAITPCVMTQAVLAVPEMECKRVLACTGRLPKTNTGVTAHSDKKILIKFW